MSFAVGRVISDLLMIGLALIIAYYLRMVWFQVDFGWFGVLELFPAPITLLPFDLFRDFAFKFTIVIVAILALHGRYRFGADERFAEEVKSMFWGVSAGMALLLVYFFFAKFDFFSRLIFGLSWLLSLVFVLLGRASLRGIRRFIWAHGYGKTRILFLGTGKLAEQALDVLLASPQFKVIGVLSEKRTTKKTVKGIKILGTFKNFEAILKKEGVDEVFLATDHSSEDLTIPLITTAQVYHKDFRFLPDELALDLAAVRTTTIKGLPVISLLNTRLDGWGLVIKTFFDYLLATLGLIILSPILLVISLSIWFKDRKAPIFYGSPRVGKKGKVFNCYKFRTMVPDAEDQKAKLLKKNQRKGGVLFKIENDPRITKLGAFLRQYSLDELPQLWNIVKGDMSLIGPRPHLPEEVKKYPRMDLQLLTIKPGLSGFSQINGRSDLSFEEEVNYEMFYMKNWSPWLDVVIFFKSIWVIFEGDNR